jgi:hypothetical protein
VTEIESRRHPTWQLKQPPVSAAARLMEVGVVGLGRFELPTSPLSGVRSNQLSYGPLDQRLTRSSASRSGWGSSGRKRNGDGGKPRSSICFQASRESGRDNVAAP